MSGPVLLNLLNELGKRDKIRGLPIILSLFSQMSLNNFWRENDKILPSFCATLKWMSIRY